MLPSDVQRVAADGLAGFFCLSAVLKLRAPEASEVALAAIGWPLAAVRAAIKFVMLVELATAVVLVAIPSRVVGGLALILILGFSTFIVLLNRRAPDVGCGCMGDAGSSTPLASFFRNGFLMSLSALVAVGPTGSNGVLQILAGAGVVAIVYFGAELVTTLQNLAGDLT